MRGDTGIRRHGDRWQVYWYERGRRRFETVRGNLTLARKVRAQRILEAERRRHDLPDRRRAPTLREFVENSWRPEIAVTLSASTRRAYETALVNHLLPAFGSTPVDEISKATVQKLIAEKMEQQRFDYTRGKNPRPDRPTLAGKTIKNMIATLSSILSAAAEDYELLARNPILGVLRERRRRRFPTRSLRTKPKVHHLEPEDFKRAVAAIKRDDVRQMVLVAALAGLRWGEQAALRVEDLNWRRNRIVVTRALYRRIPGVPKTEGSEGEVPICPTVRRILQRNARDVGYIFSIDGVTPLGDGTWIKRQWQAAQKRAGIRTPISWHDLRHQFVSLLIAAGKHPKQIAAWARHTDAGFSMKKYGHLFDSMPITPIEWWDDLLWPTGCPHVPTEGNVTEGVAP